MKSFILLSDERISAVAESFKNIGFKGIEAFENFDPQMKYAKELSKKCKALTPILLGINGLISYMLNKRGEEFWRLFADFSAERCWSISPVRLVEEFTVKNNSFNLAAKLRRLKKLYGCSSLLESLRTTNLKEYWNLISTCVHAEKSSKTVVFSVKMFYYGLKALGYNIEVPPEIPIPVDRRISLITQTSGIVKSREKMDLKVLRAISKDLMKRRSKVQEAWFKVSRLSGFPPLLLDSPLWIIGGRINLGTKRSVARSLIEEGLGDVIEYEKIWDLTKELLYYFPK